MNPIELFISLLAPHICLVCKSEGSILCSGCAETQLAPPERICYRCRSPSRLNPCPECSQNSSLTQLAVATNYEGASKEVIAALKFGRAKAAVKVIASSLPSPPPKNVYVCPVPTANKRVRGRGYDQACLIAKAYAKKHGLKYKKVLRRTGSTRQVGANRAERFSQLKNSYTVIKNVKGVSILLVDDVLTTGATMESAAKLLLKSGAKSVSAAVFAYSKPKNSSNTRSDAVSNRR